MTRKPLPKAITRPISKLRDAGAEIVTDEEAPSPRAAVSSTRIDAEPALPVSSAPIANDLVPAAAPAKADAFADAKAFANAKSLAETKAFAAKRLFFAGKIVDRHRTYAAMGGLVPLPVVNIAGLTAINVRMVQQLSALYQVPFQRDRTRAMIIGLMGGAVPTGLGAATASTLTFVIPAAAFVGLGVSAITAAAVTRAIGRVFIESLESSATVAGPA